MEEDLVKIKEQYEKIKRDMDIKQHDLKNIKEGLKELGIKTFDNISKNIKDIESEIKKGREKIGRLVAKANKILEEYEE